VHEEQLNTQGSKQVQTHAVLRTKDTDSDTFDSL